MCPYYLDGDLSSLRAPATESCGWIPRELGDTQIEFAGSSTRELLANCAVFKVREGATGEGFPGRSLKTQQHVALVHRLGPVDLLGAPAGHGKDSARCRMLRIRIPWRAGS